MGRFSAVDHCLFSGGRELARNQTVEGRKQSIVNPVRTEAPSIPARDHRNGRLTVSLDRAIRIHVLMTAETENKSESSKVVQAFAVKDPPWGK